MNNFLRQQGKVKKVTNNIEKARLNVLSCYNKDAFTLMAGHLNHLSPLPKTGNEKKQVILELINARTTQNQPPIKIEVKSDCATEVSTLETGENTCKLENAMNASTKEAVGYSRKEYTDTLDRRISVNTYKALQEHGSIKFAVIQTPSEVSVYSLKEASSAKKANKLISKADKNNVLGWDFFTKKSKAESVRAKVMAKMSNSISDSEDDSVLPATTNKRMLDFKHGNGGKGKGKGKNISDENGEGDIVQQQSASKKTKRDDDGEYI